MRLYLISQEQNDWFDTYDSAIVAAENEDIARNINPGNGEQITDWKDFKHSDSWCEKPEDVSVTYIGEAKEGTERGVILTSFNAG